MHGTGPFLNGDSEIGNSEHFAGGMTDAPKWVLGNPVSVIGPRGAPISFYPPPIR